MHGVEEATDHLAEYCRQNTSIQVNQVFTPRCGDTVDSTGERYIYQVRFKIEENDTGGNSGHTWFLNHRFYRILIRKITFFRNKFSVAFVLIKSSQLVFI